MKFSMKTVLSAGATVLVAASLASCASDDGATAGGAPDAGFGTVGAVSTIDESPVLDARGPQSHHATL